MNCTSTSRIRLSAGAFALAAAFVCEPHRAPAAPSAAAQPVAAAASLDKSWATVQSLSLERAAQVKQCFVQGHTEFYQSADVRRWMASLRQKNASANEVIDCNAVTGFSWYTDHEKWRIDSRPVYPVIERPYEQMSFDGEEYTSYTDATGESQILGDIANLETGAPEAWGKSDFRSFAADCVFGAGMVSELTNERIGKDAMPIYRADEPINGVPCWKFDYHGDSSDKTTKDLSVWFSPADKLVMKARIEYRNNAQGKDERRTVTEYAILKLQREKGIDIPSQVKVEGYSKLFKSKPFEWVNTRIFTATKIQINDPNSVSAFANNVRVTAMVDDTIADPGRFHRLGGDLDDITEQVRNGKPPQLEEPGIVADGAAPEVEAQQRAQDAKNSQQ